MHVLSLTPLIFLLSVVRSLEAVSLVSKPGSRLRTRSDSSDSPDVIDATNGQLEIANKMIAPDGFSRRLVCVFGDVSRLLTCVPSATLAGGTFPGPIIKAQKVRGSPLFSLGSCEI
jgi:hypothetical protein